jgi:hypothetical protein
MKVYIVYRDDIDGPSTVRGFLDRKKAREYVDLKNETSEYDWCIDEVEVEE